MSSVELPGEVVREHYRRQGAEAERERLLRIVDNELEMCACEEPMKHLRKRISMIPIEGENK